jgi:SAM-dependent methyltransferase
LVKDAMVRRITERIATTGSIKLPAVPALVDQYVQICAAVFAATGRPFLPEELESARQVISDELKHAFAGSPRSKIEITFEAESSRPLQYAVKQDVRTIADAYERWIGTSEGPLFGANPDARVLSLATAFSDPAASPILDFGAGTGRNALPLARLGYPVDAVEITPKFAEILRNAAAEEQLPVRVVVNDVFLGRAGLACNYALLFASEVVPDFRGVADLRHLFELAADVLAPGGRLLFNVHLCEKGYTPDKAAREFAQQCYSCLYTPNEVAAGAEGLPFVLIANDSVLDFEMTHLPAGAWPPTPWYVNWISGLDLYEIEREDCPVELRWLVFEKRHAEGGSVLPLVRPSLEQGAGAPVITAKAARSRRFDPTELRKALVRRLTRRMSASCSLTLPAIPGMVDSYAERFTLLVRALGRKPVPEQTHELKDDLERMVGEAFAQSQRSNVVVTCDAPTGMDLRYTVTADPFSLVDAYEQWHAALPEPMFGAHPDARLLSLLADIADPKSCSILDIGAGLGRNALALAERGFCVDALEIIPRFAESLRSEATRLGLSIRVIERDFLAPTEDLGRDYRLVLLSGTVGDFRDLAQLRRTFEIAAEVLGNGGLLLLNLHLAADGYAPDAAARQWAQQCCATLFTTSELEQVTADLPLLLVSDDSTYDYEQEHLRVDAWPPTPSFAEWALGQHMYVLDREPCPIELRWLVFRKTT